MHESFARIAWQRQTSHVLYVNICLMVSAWCEHVEWEFVHEAKLSGRLSSVIGQRLVAQPLEHVVHLKIDGAEASRHAELGARRMRIDELVKIEARRAVAERVVAEQTVVVDNKRRSIDMASSTVCHDLVESERECRVAELVGHVVQHAHRVEIRVVYAQIEHIGRGEMNQLRTGVANGQQKRVAQRSIAHKVAQVGVDERVLYERDEIVHVLRCVEVRLWSRVIVGDDEHWRRTRRSLLLTRIGQTATVIAMHIDESERQEIEDERDTAARQQVAG